MYVEEKKWESVEPISDWKAPDSLQMSAVSYFFKLSMILRYDNSLQISTVSYFFKQSMILRYDNRARDTEEW